MVTGYDEIGKNIADLKASPNINDYKSEVASWSWENIWNELDTPNGLINQAHECIDRHADGDRAQKLAMIWNSSNGIVEEYTFADLKKETNIVANAFRKAGINKGDRVFSQ